MSEFDATDRRILAALQKDGRMTNADLSDAANLSPSACHRRVQRLEQEGIIAAYVALLDARKLGRPTTVFVEITLSGQADEVLEAFEREVKRVPDVLECHLMAGTANQIGRQPTRARGGSQFASTARAIAAGVATAAAT
jgi:Lrp/AsnC family leucine-responsive transcriptional regulator